MKKRITIKAIASQLTAIAAFALICTFMIIASAELLAPKEQIPPSTMPSTNVLVSGDPSPEDTDAPETTLPISGDPVTEPPFTEETTVPTQGEKPIEFGSLEQAVADGWKISWADYDSSMKLVELKLTNVKSDYSNTKKVISVLTPLRYTEAGLMFESYVDKTVDRAVVELYMGYIMIDLGIANAASVFPDEITGEKVVYENISTIAIYSSYGDHIGNYRASDIVPAFHRDLKDRPLFIKDKKYYYLNEKTGFFEESDFVLETDGRGLSFDYNPEYGKSTGSLKIFHTIQEVTMSYKMNTADSYTRSGVDYRIARELYELNPAYAEKVASGDKNPVFAAYLAIAKREIALENAGQNKAPNNGSSQGVLSPETTVPETTVPETTVPETTVPETTVPETTVPETTAPETTVPETTVPETTVPETTVPETTVPETTVPETTVPETTVPETTVPETTVPETTVPETTVPETTAPETTVPETTAPEATAPETTVPETTAPETTVPETTVPVTTAPETAPPETTATSGKIVVTTTFTAYRFAYGKKAPAVDMSYILTSHRYTTQYHYQTLSWPTNYKYAKAYNYSEDRAVTVDDNGLLRIINTSGKSVAFKFYSYKGDAEQGKTYFIQYYSEPFYKDVSQIGHYYYDEGYIRVRFLERRYHSYNDFQIDRDILLDKSGNEYEMPNGYDFVSYSDGVILLERNGRYGYYSVDGYWIVQPVYTYAQPFVEGIGVIGYEGGVVGAVDTEGNVVIPFEYKTITNSSSGVFACYSEQNGWKVLAKVDK